MKVLGDQTCRVLQPLWSCLDPSTTGRPAFSSLNFHRAMWRLRGLRKKLQRYYGRQATDHLLRVLWKKYEERRHPSWKRRNPGGVRRNLWAEHAHDERSSPRLRAPGGAFTALRPQPANERRARERRTNQRRAELWATGYKEAALSEAIQSVHRRTPPHQRLFPRFRPEFANFSGRTPPSAEHISGARQRSTPLAFKR